MKTERYKTSSRKSYLTAKLVQSAGIREDCPEANQSIRLHANES